MNLLIDWISEKFSSCFSIFVDSEYFYFSHIVLVCQKKAYFFSFLHDHGRVSDSRT